MKEKMKGLNILIVDDDPDLRDLVSCDFSMMGAEVDTAESGSKALALILQNNFDLIISDMRMPNGDGRFLAREVMKLPGNNKPLFFLYSGYSDVSPQEAKDLQILHIFGKPYKASEMMERILSLMPRKMAA